MTAHPTSSPPPRFPIPRLSRPWAVVAAIFVVFTFCSGLSVYCMSVFLHAFVASGRFTLDQASFAASGFAVAYGLVGLVVGGLVDRHDVRRVITGGAMLMAAALFALPWVDSLPTLYAFFITLGIGYGTAALIPGTTVVARWFGAKRRPAAMSIAATGNSFGAIVLTPPAVLLIAAYGLDAASPWLALALLLGVLPPAWLVVRSWPRELGAAPLGEDADAPASADAGDAAHAFSRALRSRYFWAANAAFLLGMAAHVGGQTHLFNLLMLREDDAARAGAAIALMAGASVLSRVVAVWLLARMSSRAFVMLLLGVQGGALAAIGTAGHDWVLYPAIALYGTTLGNLVTAQSLLLVEGFGIAAYARIYGLSRVVGTLGVVFGPGLMGLSAVAQQSYVGAFVGIGLVSAAGIAALAVSGRPG